MFYSLVIPFKVFQLIFIIINNESLSISTFFYHFFQPTNNSLYKAQSSSARLMATSLVKIAHLYTEGSRCADLLANLSQKRNC